MSVGSVGCSAATGGAAASSASALAARSSAAQTTGTPAASAPGAAARLEQGWAISSRASESWRKYATSGAVQQHVERHHRAARVEDAEVGDRELRQVRHQQRDAIAGGETARAQARGDAARGAVELA